MPPKPVLSRRPCASSPPRRASSASRSSRRRPNSARPSINSSRCAVLTLTYDRTFSKRNTAFLRSRRRLRLRFDLDRKSEIVTEGSIHFQVPEDGTIAIRPLDDSRRTWVLDHVAFHARNAVDGVIEPRVEGPLQL